MDVALPDLPYVNINFTMPHELLPIFQRNRRLLHDLPALRAAAIQHWARARYGVRVLILVVQQSFGGLLKFHPHFAHLGLGRWSAGVGKSLDCPAAL